MIEKIKYHLSRIFNSRQMRVSCMAVMTALTIAVVTLLGNSIYTVNIFDGENTYTVRTLSNNVTKVLSNVNLKSSSYNIANTKVVGRTTNIEILYTFPVFVTCGDKTTEISFTGGTVKDALAQAGYTADEYDFIEPAADTEIKKTVYIDYTDISYVDGKYTEAIPYSTKTVYSSNILRGETSLKAGTNGLKEVNYTEKFVNGVSVEKTVVSTNVVAEPVSAVKTVGTRAYKTSADVKAISVLSPSSAIELDKNGNPVKFKSKMTVRATAYTYTGNNCSTGVAPKPGYIAVNPKVIPYGTKLYIKSPDGSITYGYAVAADTGGFIKKHPTGIDLFMTSKSACRNFGVRNMEVYILE